MNCKSCVKYYGSPRISSEFKDCALPLTFDQYNFCSFGCQYCFGVQFKVNNPAYKDTSIKYVNAKRLSEILKGKYPKNPYYENFFKNRFIFHWGGLTEPFCNFEKKYNIGLKILETLKELKYPTLFSTKGLSMFMDDKKYMSVFEDNAKHNNFAFQFSIITNRDDISLEIEPNTPTTSERLAIMKRMSDLGYWTILRLRPFILGLSDIEIEALLERAKANGARAISLEFFALDARCVHLLQKNLERISKIIGVDVHEFYRNLSPTERGTYMRLNWDVKERIMKRIYIKCRLLGLQINISDPDFKELNDSGCCCGLPSEHPNPEMTNWSRGQLTELIRLVRAGYWGSEGRVKDLTFEDIESRVANNWFEESRYLKDSIKYWNTDFSKTKAGHKTEFIHSWNNLRSPDNPYNHYHGLLKPVKIDEKRKMLIYEYSPREYEYRWKKEGIL